MTRRSRPVPALVLIAVALLGGCEDTTDFGEMSEIRNDPDLFEYAVSDLKQHTSTHEYPWSNSGSVATVLQNTAVTGNAQLVIRDADGTQVYGRSLADSGTLTTTAGTPGTWTIRVSFTAATGTVIFRVANAAAP